MIQNKDNSKLIVIAEDSLTQAEGLRYMLENFGYEVIHCIDGKAALSFIKKTRPLMLISDIVMPEMNGYELCRRIKEDKYLWDLPVILLTSLSEITDVIKGLESGADGYVMKPYKEHYLLSRINHVLENKHLLLGERSHNSLDIMFAGQNYKINSNPLQILNLLLSTYDSAVQKNIELSEKEKELILMNQSLQQNVAERKEKLKEQLTQKIAAEKILRKSEEKYRALVDNAIIGVFISAIDGDLLFANDALKEMLEYESDVELLSLDTKEFYKHPEKRIDFINQLKKTGKVPAYEVEFITKKKNVIQVILSASLEGDILSGMILDITDRKLAEERVKNCQNELLSAKEKAEQSEKLKTAFLANMSNEILTPINSLVGFSELLSDPAICPERITDFTEQINKSGNYLVNLIDNIIDIAKVESGEMKIKFTKCMINHLLLDLFAYYEQEINEKGKTKINLFLKRGNKDKDFAILSEPYRLKQILSNLLGNALKYTDSGSIEFGYRIISEEDPSSQSHIQMYVKDTGRGIPREKLNLIFDRFRHSDNSYTKLFEGAGLGLPISKAYVELLGGKLYCNSEIGQGSEFSFILPFIPAETKLIDETIIGKPADIVSLENHTIMVAEDVESNYIIIKALLKETKVRLKWAKDGQEAIQKFRDNKNIDLILMDLRMPVMSGYEAIAEIRKTNTDIPIVVQTAFAREDDRQTILDSGCNDYITKPINKNLLINFVYKYLGKTPAALPAGK